MGFGRKACILANVPPKSASTYIRVKRSREEDTISGAANSKSPSTISPAGGIHFPDIQFPEIQDYAVIGDCRAAALVSRYGAVEWLCWPRFEKPSIFAAILDRKLGGHWTISPSSYQHTERSYIPSTNVLQTRFIGPEGAVLLTDLMPMASAAFSKSRVLPDHEIIRRVECTEGQAEVKFDFLPRANYGRNAVVIGNKGHLGLRMECSHGVYWLRSPIPLAISDGSAQASFTMRKGESLNFSLSYSEEAPAVLPVLNDAVVERIQETVTWWQKWAELAEYKGEFRDQVIRSALTLKLMNHLPSGAIIAAPTTSLPEKIGAELNWDYRYCWLRDASLTTHALLELGYWREAGDFLDWMLHATRLTQPKLRIVYSVFGEMAPKEELLEELTGYKNSRPVRVGNAARNQLQLDVYGEVIDAAAQYAFHGGTLDREMQKALRGFANYVVKHWEQPDAGIWEPRSGRQNHTHSRLLCWVALDRMIALCEKGSLKKAPLDTYKKQAELIRNQIRERAWNSELQSYVSVLGGNTVDASLLLISWYGFEKADSPRMQGTYKMLRERLGKNGQLINRSEDSSGEGAFAICSFWEAEFLSLGGGTLEDAKQLLRQLLKFSNDLGLYSEEIDPKTGAALGNFPQAFTHIGLIGAALSIAQREEGEQQLAHRPEQATQQGATQEVSA